MIQIPINLFIQVFPFLFNSVIFPFTTALFDGQPSAFELFYGKITNLEDMFVLPLNKSANPRGDNDFELNSTRRVFRDLVNKVFDDNELLEAGDDHDIQEFNAMTVELNSARKSYARYINRYDRADLGYWGRSESRKKSMLMMASLQFLIHTRYKVRTAVRLRNVVKSDKRYRLGYLFSRLRRLITAQRKMASAAQGNRLNRHAHNLNEIMTLYQKVVRLDVDIRDTINRIKIVYGEKANIDMVYK